MAPEEQLPKWFWFPCVSPYQVTSPNRGKHIMNVMKRLGVCGRASSNLAIHWGECRYHESSFITKQHTSQHYHVKLDIELQMKAHSFIMWWLLKLHWLQVRFIGGSSVWLVGVPIVMLRWLLVIKFYAHLSIILICLEITCFYLFGTPTFSMPVTQTFLQS